MSQKPESLAYACPFCHAPANSPCVARTSGQPRKWTHLSRRDLNEPPQRPPRVDALCCACGERRTMSVDYYRYNDPNYDDSEAGKRGGWRNTQSLKCVACGETTRHAIVSRDGGRYWDEWRQRVALGEDTSHWTPTHVVRTRREYREMPFPRNPNLYHRHYTRDAERAWDDGSKQVLALCGEPVKIKRDPRQASKYSRKSDEHRVDGYLVAEIESDVELTDIDTGLSWIAMDCVDCCRVSNQKRLAKQRERLEWFLRWFALAPDKMPDHSIETVLAQLEPLWEQVTKKSS